MLTWLYNIIIGCNHKWHTFHKLQWYNSAYEEENGKGLPMVQYQQECQECGEIKHQDIQGWIE